MTAPTISHAIALGALGHLVAAEILVDLADEAVGSIGGKRQVGPHVSSGQSVSSAGRSAFIPRPG